MYMKKWTDGNLKTQINILHLLSQPTDLPIYHPGKR